MNAKLKRERFWQCPECAAVHERNVNAAVNLRNLLTLPAGSGVTLRDGKALAVGLADDETGPRDRRTAKLGTGSGNADCVFCTGKATHVPFFSEC